MTPDTTPDDFAHIVATLAKVPTTDTEPDASEWETIAAEYALKLGRDPTPAELADLLRDYLGHLRSDVLTEARSGDAIDPEEALDPVTFAERFRDVLPRWGVGDSRPYWASGEALVIFGGDGTHKTTLAQGLALRLAGCWPDSELLGLYVEPLAEGERVLYLALDRPAQIARSLDRFLARLPHEHLARIADRLTVWPGSLPEWAGDRPDGLAEYVERLGDRLGCRFGAVIIDNVSDLWGNLSDTDQATLAGQACNRLAGAGVEVVALHHPRKRDEKTKRRPESIEDVYGGRMFTKATGAVLGLHRADDSDDAPLTVTHLKGPLGFRRRLLAIPNLPTGDLDAAPDSLADVAPKGGTDAVAARVAEALRLLEKSRGGATVAEVFDVLEGHAHDRSDPAHRARYAAIGRALESLGGAYIDGRRGASNLWRWSDAR